MIGIPVEKRKHTSKQLKFTIVNASANLLKKKDEDISLETNGIRVKNIYTLTKDLTRCMTNKDITNTNPKDLRKNLETVTLKTKKT